jgi:OmpA-OmpF porin, OOP family
MKKIINLTLAFLIALSMSSQNLVSNESFEKYKKCPEDLGEFDKVTGWYNPTKGTPDFFCTCFKGKNKMGIPGNYMGTQTAKEGLAYAGIIAYSERSANYREYIAQKLAKPLMKDSIYLVSFHVSLADFSTYAVSSIGLLFSTSEIKSTTWNQIDSIPQIENPSNNNITNKSDWVKISSKYTAIGDERYIIIGNFKKDKNSLVKIISKDKSKKSDQKAYYYVDLVSIELVREGN